MERITDEILKITQECRDELSTLEKHIEHYKNNMALNEQEYTVYKILMRECHDNMRRKIHLLTTILETSSTEILDVVKQQKKSS